jgi:hypothetical protein
LSISGVNGSAKEKYSCDHSTNNGGQAAGLRSMLLPNNFNGLLRQDFTRLSGFGRYLLMESSISAGSNLWQGRISGNTPLSIAHSS